MKDVFKVLLIAVSLLLCYQSYRYRKETAISVERTNALIRECQELERRQDELRRERAERDRIVTHVRVGEGLIDGKTMLEENSWSPKKE